MFLVLGVNTEKTSTFGCIVSYQNAGKTRNRKITNTSFEYVAMFKSLGTTVTDQDLIQEEMKSRLNSSNVCYHSVQKSVFSSVV
jgi:hypothetical protein